MGVIWRASENGVSYEVRRRGSLLRLFANGVQHSEFHPERMVTGSVWDLLWLPALFHDPRRIQRVLVLGLGGGSLIPPLRRFVQPRDIVAVEKDPFHLHVAEKVFAIAGDDLQTVCADAREWVSQWQGEPFDLIVEDLFAPSDRTVSRAIKPSGRWFGALSRMLSPTGTLVMNFGDWQEFRDSPLARTSMQRGWQGGFRFATPDCHNAVVAWLREDSETGELRDRLRGFPELAAALDRRKLDYTVRRVFRREG